MGNTTKVHFSLNPMTKKRLLNRTIVDCFLAFDELDLALFRINYLSPLIDYTIIGESTYTHSGQAKDLYFSKWIETLPISIRKKVEIVTIDLEDRLLSGSWSREITSRERLLRCAIDKFPDSKVVLSDLDEIPSLQQLSSFSTVEGNYHFRCRTTYRFANLYVGGKHDRWDYGVMLGNPRDVQGNSGRFQKFPLIQAEDHGVHFSYLDMGPERLRKKFNSFAHEEYSQLGMDFEKYLNYCNSYGVDHLGRIRSETFGILRYESPENPSSSLLKGIYNYFPSKIAYERVSKLLPLRLLASGTISFLLRRKHEDRFKSFRDFLLKGKFGRSSLLHRISTSLLLNVIAFLELSLALIWNIRNLWHIRRARVSQ